jgi:hypothetical protein
VLELLFACDGAARVAKILEIHETMDGVLAGVGAWESFAMGRSTAFQVVCHANVEIARTAGEDVDPEVVLAERMPVGYLRRKC